MRYKKLTELGAGSFGTVHKAIDVDTGKFMAVKILRGPSEGNRDALKREVEILSTLKHVGCTSPAICAELIAPAPYRGLHYVTRLG